MVDQELLFTYGTLQLEEVQLSVFGRRLKGSKDTLSGYVLGKIAMEEGDPFELAPQSYYPIAIPSENSEDEIQGVLYAVSKEELVLADAYEGDSYQRIRTIFLSGRSGWVYTKS